MRKEYDGKISSSISWILLVSRGRKWSKKDGEFKKNVKHTNFKGTVS
jgi:hypothetical protein